MRWAGTTHRPRSWPVRFLPAANWASSRRSSGAKDVIEAELVRQGATASSFDIVHASEAIGMDEHPAQAVRAKKDASINVAMEMVKRGVASGFVSAGNTGAVMASALMTLGRIPGVERPALGTIAPYSPKGILVLDVGANADVKPSYMVQFAQMGSVYAERVLGIPNPRVALLNIGGEETKGSELVQEVYERLEKAGVNFVGNIEGGEVHRLKADVIVTDGFTGNVAMKVTEGVADFIFRELRYVADIEAAIQAGGDGAAASAAADARPDGPGDVRRRAAARRERRGDDRPRRLGRAGDQERAAVHARSGGGGDAGGDPGGVGAEVGARANFGPAGRL